MTLDAASLLIGVAVGAMSILLFSLLFGPDTRSARCGEYYGRSTIEWMQCVDRLGSEPLHDILTDTRPSDDRE